MAKINSPEDLLSAAALLDDILNYKGAEELASTWRKSAEYLSTQKALLDFGGLSWQMLALDGNKALLITTDIVDEQSYDDNSEAEEVTWSNCSLRKYLNNTFLRKFNSTELSQIVDVVNSNECNEKYGTNGGATTTDKVFNLSIDDVRKHLNNNDDRIGKIDGEVSCWWLRSPGEYPINAVFINDIGDIDFSGDCVDFKNGIRPALWRIMS